MKEHEKDARDKELKKLILGYAGFQVALLFFAMSEHKEIKYLEVVITLLAISIPSTIFSVGFHGTKGISQCFNFYLYHFTAAAGLIALIASYSLVAGITATAAIVLGGLHLIVWLKMCNTSR